MERKFSFAPGEYYHIYNRGTEKRTIFHDQRDYLRFLVLLYVCNSKSRVFHPSDWKEKPPISIFSEIMIKSADKLVDIGAYCLMPNHFHLLLRAKDETGVSRYMLKVQTGYPMYFNKKYERSGNLFSGKFRAQHVDNDRYLRYLFSYIHLNPVKKLDPAGWEKHIIGDHLKAKRFLDQYEYSSYHHYLGQSRPHHVILSVENFPNYFDSTKDFVSFVSDWLSNADLNVKGRP